MGARLDFGEKNAWNQVEMVIFKLINELNVSTFNNRLLIPYHSCHWVWEVLERWLSS